MKGRAGAAIDSAVANSGKVEQRVLSFVRSLARSSSTTAIAAAEFNSVVVVRHSV